MATTVALNGVLLNLQFIDFGWRSERYFGQNEPANNHGDKTGSCEAVFGELVQEKTEGKSMNFNGDSEIVHLQEAGLDTPMCIPINHQGCAEAEHD